MPPNNNDNVSVSVFLNDNNNINNTNNKYGTSKKAEKVAWMLVDKFHAPDSFLFYCKVAYALSEHKIWLNYEKATSSKGTRNPAGLFNWLCKRDMA